MQPGSSIMPGKVNPVIPEVVNQICYRIMGNDMTVTLAAEAGQLQLNVLFFVLICQTLYKDKEFHSIRQRISIYNYILNILFNYILI